MTSLSAKQPAHVVVATVVEDRGRYLFVEEQIGDRRVINQPAGHWEPGETLLEGAQRETLEESGWDVEVTALVGIYDYSPPELEYGFLRFAFLAKAIRHHPDRPLDVGILRAIWLSREELLAAGTELRSPMVLRCLDDARAGTHYPLSLVAQLRA